VFADLGGVTGPAMAVLSATLFGLAALPAKRGLNYVSAEVGALVTIVTTWVICLLLSPFWMRSSDWFTPGFWVFVLAGLIHPYLSMYSSFEALRRAGTTVASTLAATSPFFSTLGALIFLDEELSLIVALATVGIVAGIVVLTFDGGRVARMMRVARRTQVDFRPIPDLATRMGQRGAYTGTPRPGRTQRSGGAREESIRGRLPRWRSCWQRMGR